MTIWTAIAAIGTLLILLSGGIWAFVSFRSDIAVNAEALKGLGEKHNTFAARVGEDLKRLESYIDTRIKDILGDRGRQEVERFSSPQVNARGPKEGDDGRAWPIAIDRRGPLGTLDWESNVRGNHLMMRTSASRPRA